MLLALKAIHILSLAVGIGGSVAALITGGRAAKAGHEAAQALSNLQKLLGRIVFAAIVLLWITGVWMLGAAYGWQVKSLGSLFNLKMAVVLILTVVATTSQLLVLRAARRNEKPKASTMNLLGQTGLVSAVTAAVLAVYTFS